MGFPMTSTNESMQANDDDEPKALNENKEEPTKNDVKTISKSATTNDEPEFGWSSYAERVNGRFAMVGFLAILLIEVLSKSSILDWAGLLS